MPYTLPQLRLLILLALTLLVGLGVREWRAGFPDAAERFERFDREDTATPLLPDADPPPAAAGPRGAPGRAAPAPPAPGAAAPRGAGAPVPFAPAAPAPPAPSPPPEPLDVNRADATELARLPGVGAGLAQRIVEERERRGRFDSPEALRYVLGMGPKKLAAIRRFIIVRD
ncbi:MAG TPA: helix-hairpin-helix domain-containing protein [Methylomirabilota bacterium]|nr:helix-hairpin-helix domain-containing protein [Methylomirabilota bacterium]